MAAYETKVELVAWVRLLVADRPQITIPRDTVEALAALLAKRVSTIATLPWAADYVHDILALEKRLRKIVQRSKGHWYAGICSAEVEPERAHDRFTCACSCHLIREALGRDPGPAACNIEGGCNPEDVVIPAVQCDRDLYAVPGADAVWCPTCRTKHSVQERRAILLEEARETLLPLTTIAQVCVTLLEGEPSVERLFKRIDNWVRRGKVEDYGVRVLHDRRPHRVYRLGDVLDMLVSEVSNTMRGASC